MRKIVRDLGLHFLLIAMLLPLIAACTSPDRSNGSPGALPMPLQIRILSVNGEPIVHASVQINKQETTTDTAGYIRTHVSAQRLYQLRIAAPGYYRMLHVFSEQEREQFDGVLPDVTLVEQVPGRVMIAFAGDAMLGRRYHQPNPGDPQLISAERRLEDSKALLRTIKPYLDLADYTSINLESPVVAKQPSTQSTKNVTFFSYPETLDALAWAGVDHVSLGNNHTYDYLDPALVETLDRLSASELAYSGAGLNETQALAPHRERVGDIQYSFMGFVGWPGKVRPSQVAEGNRKGGAAHGTDQNIQQVVSGESQRGVSVVEYHGSEEYSFQPTQLTRTRLRSAIDHGADIVVGHHPHVLHGFEIYQGKLIAYSLGNFLFDQYIYETQRSALLYVWMDGEEFHRAEVVPLYIKNYQPTPALGKMREYVLRRIMQQSHLEGVALHLSGGHAVISNYPGEREHKPLLREVFSSPTERLIDLANWLEGFEKITFRADDVAYRVGRDWWAIGNNEQEQQFGLVDRSWKFSNAESGTTGEVALGNYAMKLAIPESECQTSVGQQYFMRVWDDQPKTIALKVFANSEVEIRACLELRTLSMTTEQARINPQVSCLNSVLVEPGEWRPVQFDFDPPPRADNRGLRFRFDVTSKMDGAGAVYIDDLKFISWGLSGTSSAGETLRLDTDKQWNGIGLRSGTVNGECCNIELSRF